MTNMEHESRLDIDQYIQERNGWLIEAAQIVGADPELSLLEVFPEPGEVRKEDKGLALDSKQEADLREVAGRFGVGGEQNVASTSEVQILEGGLAWKIDAEIQITSPKGSFVVAGSKNRNITREDEAAFLQTKFGEDAEMGATEYDVARQLIEAHPGFEALEQDEELPFGYDIYEGYSLTDTPTGQFVHIGHIDGCPVVLLRVDRDNYTDEEGEKKYRNQPDGATLLGIVSDLLSATGDESSAVGLVTSNTYASRAIDVVRAGVIKGRNFDVGMYGRETLADVKGEPTSEPTEINQIPGELHKIAAKLAMLTAEIS